MTGRVVGFLLSALAVAIAIPSAGAETALQIVPLYGTAEVVLLANTAYGGAGAPNPFDLDVSLRATSPSGKVYAVPAFFDGDGQGRGAGRVFKARLATDEPGTWRWTAQGDVPGIAGRQGSFEVAGRLPGFFGCGPIVRGAGRPRVFRQREGPPVFLAGKFLDAAAPGPLRFSHTMFSERLDDGDREALLARHRALRLNKIDVYLANRGDYGGVSTTPWRGTAADNDKRAFDLARWRTYERWVERMRDAGVVAHLWFFADDSGFGALPDADRRRLIRYGMARLSAYANTMFTLALEWQEGWTPERAAADAAWLQGNNPWRRLVSLHGLTGPSAFVDAPWLDFLDVQAGNDSSPRSVHALGLAERARAAKPVLQEELALGEEDGTNRRKVWAAFTAGAAGVGTGAFLTPFVGFVSRLDLAALEPADSLVLGGSGWALAAPGRAYVVYLYDGGTVRLDFRGAAGRLAVDWYDPRTGRSLPPRSVEGGQPRTFTAPGPDDWVLYLHP